MWGCAWDDLLNVVARMRGDENYTERSLLLLDTLYRRLRITREMSRTNNVDETCNFITLHAVRTYKLYTI
jgi:hypothetical protein